MALLPPIRGPLPSTERKMIHSRPSRSLCIFTTWLTLGTAISLARRNMSPEQSLSLYLYPGVSNRPRHISTSFNIYIQLRVSGLSAGKAQKTNISIFHHTQSCQYQDEVSTLSQNNLRDTQQVGEVEPKWDRRCQYGEERIWKSLRLKHASTIEVLFKK